jgi:tetratricopeptide (TPR) repeat protein
MAPKNTPPDSLQRVASALQEAERLRLAGRRDQAEAQCREILSAEPNAAPAMNFLALLLRDRGMTAEALQWMRRAVEAAPLEASLRNNLGNLLRTRGDLAGAEASLRSAVTLKPDYAEAFYNLGIVLHELGRRDEALAAQRRAVSLRADYVQALTQLGVLLRESRAFDAALAPLEQAVAVRRDYFDAQYYLGCTYTALERFQDAEAALKAALALKPNSREALFALGNLFERASRADDAIAAYARAVNAAPDFIDAHRRLNALAWEMGRSDVTLKSYALARSRIGETPDLLLAEADQRLLQGQAEEAERLLQRAHDIAPERNDVANVLARALVSQRKFDEGIALLEPVVKVDPNAIDNYRVLASALLQSRRPREAAALLERALALSPHDQANLAFLTLAWRELGDSRLDALAGIEKFVRVYDLPPPPGFGDVAAFNRALGEDLIALHTRNTAPLDQTLRGGSQTPGFLFDNRSKALDGVREKILEAVGDYIGALPDDPSHPVGGRKSAGYDLIGAWSCRLRSSGFHTNHFHPQGWISSAYYVSLPGAVDDGEQGWLKFGESNILLGERDRPERLVKPAVGKLVLFPSYFWHGTVPFVSEAMRLTVAFDAVPGKVTGSRGTAGG